MNLDLSSILGQSGPVQLTWYYMQCIRMFGPADYLTLSGALGKPCIIVMYS